MRQSSKQTAKGGQDMKPLKLMAALGGLLLGLAGAAQAQELPLKMAHIYPPGNIWYDAAEAYAKEVELTSEEWINGLNFLARVGQWTSDARGENITGSSMSILPAASASKVR